MKFIGRLLKINNGSAFWPPAKAPDLIGMKICEDLLARRDFMLYDTGVVRALHYAEAGAAFGAARLAGLLGDAAILARLAARYAADRLPSNTANHVDANLCGIIPLELYLHDGDKQKLAAGLAFADGQWSTPRKDGLSGQTRFWIDDVWMIGVLQTQAFRATGQPLYLERAALTLRAYLQKLQQPNGLFFHGEQAPLYWGRGNGWVAAGLAEVLSALPAAHPHRPSLLAGYVRMMEALLGCQTGDGMWRQLLDHGESWPETSCTAMCGHAIALGVKTSLLPADRFAPACRKAWLALADYLTAEGRVREVCAGTGQNEEAAFYLQRPRVTGDLHGQAPLLWFCWSLLLE